MADGPRFEHQRATTANRWVGPLGFSSCFACSRARLAIVRRKESVARGREREATMKIVKMLVWTGFVAAAVLLLWPFVDHTASRVSMCVTGAGLVLAWYSILDLQEQRRERLWPHTIDRLIRATFVAVTLVFAVDLGVRPMQLPASPPPPPAVTRYFVDEVAELLRSHRWSDTELKLVVDRHFGAFLGKGSDFFLSLDGDRGFILSAPNRQVISKIR
jgi:hypothetical protein